jgi:pyruvate dehydrogenase (quinone)
MKDTGRAILKGDPDRWGVVKEGVLTKVQELLPHKEN